MPKIPLSCRPNLYWGYEVPPVECLLTIQCSGLDSNSFGRYLKDLQKEGLYYTHNTETREVTIAFQSKVQRDLHELGLKISAKANGVLLPNK